MKINQLIINYFTPIGWATDLKTVSDEVVKKRVLRTGDGSHPYSIEAKKHNIKVEEEHNNNDGERDLDHFWGWVRINFNFNNKKIII